MNTQRQVKVFVSSTFLGMGDEREVLADFVFPELRKRCAERKIDFVEIELIKQDRHISILQF
ncbi:hypothetical protein QUF50_02160 [Thiotrichales bacterium HSG1]|nr:hypothetical protein [Thiotrichales bacterium HSG1]